MSYEQNSTLVGYPGYGSQGGIWDDLLSAGSSAGSAVINVIKGQGAADAYKQQLAAQQASQAWVAPVLIGGVALVAIVLLKKRRRGTDAPKSNPARRRRRR